MQITIQDVEMKAIEVITYLELRIHNYHQQVLKVYGVPRGGLFCALILCNLNRSMRLVDDPCDADIIVDDIFDSGMTKLRYNKINHNAIFITLFNAKQFNNEWVTFPWEVLDTTGGIDDAIIRICQHSNNESEEAVEHCKGAVLLITHVLEKMK
jgi:hypoxanthine phosphoribosyltransferase